MTRAVLPPTGLLLPRRLRRFLHHVRVDFAVFPENIKIRDDPPQGVFFAGCRTDSVPVSVLLHSGGTLAARVVVLHEPDSGRHDHETVELGSKKAAKSGPPARTLAVGYHDRQPENAMASNTPTHPTPAARNTAVTTNRA